MISSNNLRPGVSIEHQGGVWLVVEFMHVKPGKGAAFVQTKLKNMVSGAVLMRNFRAGEKLVPAVVEKSKMVFSYRDGDYFVFFDLSDVDLVEVESATVGKNTDLLKEGLENILVFRHREKVIRIELPTTVELVVADTLPEARGNTTGGGSKPALLETGATVVVPIHINIGDKIIVDTRTREYLSRTG